MNGTTRIRPVPVKNPVSPFGGGEFRPDGIKVSLTLLLSFSRAAKQVGQRTKAAE